MSDTPRTDGAEIRCIDEPVQPLGMVEVDFALQLEREINAAKERIRRLEEAGNAMLREMQFGEWPAGTPRSQARASMDSWRVEMEGRL